MIYARPKNSKGQTPTRSINSHPKITQIVGIKKSDPFLRDLKEVYDKENINPNQKDRVKSYSSKNQHQRSPKQKGTKYNKLYQHLTHYNSRPSNKLHSNSKEYNSTEMGKHQSRLKSSNRKSTEKDDPMVNHFQEEYYSAKEERPAKKTKVTLKDTKKRKSIAESEHEYKYQDDTKQSLTRDLVGSLKKELLRSNEKNREYEGLRSQQSVQARSRSEDHFCCMHPEKKASHKLMEGNRTHAYCQKCAISLVTKGHKMQQLVPVRPSTRQDSYRQSRLDILKDFLFNLDQLQPVTKQTRNDISSFREISQYRFDQEKQQLDNYYIKLNEELTISYEKSVMNLKMYFNAVSEQFEKNDELLNALTSKIASIKEDILPNVNTIVQESRVQEDQFNTILHNYQQELRIVENNLRQLYQYTYNNYYCDYSQNNSIAVNLRNMVSPPIISQNIREGMQTKRRTTDDSNTKKVEYFRLSFGKEVPGSDYKTL